MSGRPVTNFNDWMRQTERRLLGLERRGTPTASTLMGPGLAPTAVQVSDWNGETALSNGMFFSTAPDAIHSPNSTKSWIGTTLTDSEGNGVQRVTAYNDTGDGLFGGVVVHYIRAFNSTGATPVFTTWAVD